MTYDKAAPFHCDGDNSFRVIASQDQKQNKTKQKQRQQRLMSFFLGWDRERFTAQMAKAEGVVTSQLYLGQSEERRPGHYNRCHLHELYMISPI